MKGFTIELTNPSQSYFAGEKVDGRVIVQNDLPVQINEISVLFEGTGRVQLSLTETFTVGEPKTIHGKTEIVPHKQTRVVAYSENEKYFSQRISLLGDGQTVTTLQAGTSVYPFEFVLPINCPSSFSTKFGYVAYSIEAEAKRPLPKTNKKTELNFTVNGVFDLNADTGANQPQRLRKVKGGNFLVCRKGQLRFILHLPRSGYVPGEILDFSSEITNTSNKRISKVKASLVQVMQFQAKSKKKVEKRSVCKVRGPEVEAGEYEMWKPDSIVIPCVPPTRLGGEMCRNIDVQYYLRFEVQIGGLSKAFFGELPVLIGTKPLKGTCEEVSDKLDNST